VQALHFWAGLGAQHLSAICGCIVTRNVDGNCRVKGSGKAASACLVLKAGERARAGKTWRSGFWRPSALAGDRRRKDARSNIVPFVSRTVCTLELLSPQATMSCLTYHYFFFVARVYSRNSAWCSCPRIHENVSSMLRRSQPAMLVTEEDPSEEYALRFCCVTGDHDQRIGSARTTQLHHLGRCVPCP
jgi:hypothetical protein